MKAKNCKVYRFKDVPVWIAEFMKHKPVYTPVKLTDTVFAEKNNSEEIIFYTANHPVTIQELQ